MGKQETSESETEKKELERDKKIKWFDEKHRRGSFKKIGDNYIRWCWRIKKKKGCRNKEIILKIGNNLNYHQQEIIQINYGISLLGTSIHQGKYMNYTFICQHGWT